MSGVILFLSGPNLNLLGERSPEIYGTETLADHERRFTAVVAPAGYSVRSLQSNSEVTLIEAIHEARASAVAIVFNPGALTHSSWALRDALETFSGPKIEVHLSNPAAREPFRHLSTVAGAVSGSIAGFGALGYELAAHAVLARLKA
jgi:3-dehydroquinate dehydratase type II